MSWEPLKNFENTYEINTAYPYNIRKIATGRILREKEHGGYIRISLNAKDYMKHCIIAKQFIPNNDPKNKIQIDHINHDKLDNHIENLRWITVSDNLRNRTRANGVDYEYINELPGDSKPIQYNNYGLANYFFSKEANTFYLKTFDDMFRVLKYHDCKGCLYVNVITNEKKKKRLYLKKTTTVLTTAHEMT